MRHALLALALAAAAGSGHAAAQTSAAAEPPRVIGLVHFIHATDTLETTTGFYKEVFGLEAPLRPFENPAVATLNNVPGIVLRMSRPIFPDKAGFEITEFTNVTRKGGRAAPSDPGAITLMIPVRSLDVVLAALKTRAAPIVTASGGPQTITTAKGPRRAIVLRDPDGYLVWVMEVPAAEAVEPGLIQPGVTMVVTVPDLDKAEAFYRGLGFEFSGSRTFTRDAAMAALFGLPASSERREVSAPIPGTVASRVAFVEWKGMPRTPFYLNVYDPGAGGFVLRVTKIDEMVAKMKADGLRVISAGGGPVPFGPTSRNVFVVDPNGMNLELTESTPRPPSPATGSTGLRP
jgi:catechol 2,3-dioxygenase-like lactoylglutathione lyase family enzyme